jgi:hypothetical protein
MNTQAVRVALGLLALALTAQAESAEPTLPKDGWAGWEVAAVEGAPDWCCWSSWNHVDGTRTACRLDEERGNSSNRDHATTDAVRVYARMAGGKVERVRTLSATCPVETRTPIQELGNVSTDDSARWLVSLTKVGNESTLNEDAYDNVMAALASHRGEVAQNALATMAHSDTRTESRKKAIFWLAVLRGTAGADVVSSVLFNDKNPELREHATFAIAQSKSPRVAQELIRAGNTDTNGEVRGQAWFWLAQTGAADAEVPIRAAITKDKDGNVREKAVFALSQLPDERATRALISVAEDRSLSHEQRKRAVFWLAQSDAEGAQKYLEKVLLGKAGS